MTDRRVVVADINGNIRVARFPSAPPHAGEVHVDAFCSLISPGTELHYLKQDSGVPSGYCSAGVVSAVAADVPNISPGDRVVCMGWGYATHTDSFSIPWRLAHRLPTGMTLRDGVVAGLGATAVHAIDRAQLSADAEVVILGAGIVGQLVAQCAAGCGASVEIADISTERVRSAMRLLPPADLGYGQWRESAARIVTERHRVAFVCFEGSLTDSWADLVAWWRGSARPTCVVVGRVQLDVTLSVDLGNLDLRISSRCGAGYRDDDYVRGNNMIAAPPGESTVDGNIARAIELIRRGVIRPAAMEIRDMCLEDAPAAYELLARRSEVVSVRLYYGAFEEHKWRSTLEAQGP